MARNLAILTTLALFLFSGCIGGPTAPTEDTATTNDATTDPAPEASSPEVQEAPALPKCPKNSNRSNYGTWNQIGDDYIVSPYGGYALVYYKESNGCKGLQIESEWGHNPDTKVAEVPYPILPGHEPTAAKA